MAAIEIQSLPELAQQLELLFRLFLPIRAKKFAAAPLLMLY